MRGNEWLVLLLVGAVALFLISWTSQQSTPIVDEVASVAVDEAPLPPNVEQCETYETIAVAHTSWVDSKEVNKSTYDDDKLHIMSSDEKAKRTYYYFEIPAHPGSLVSAELVIDIEDKGELGQVAVYSTSWDGAPVSWNSGPPQGTYLDHKDFTGGPCRFDVSSAVTGGGPVSFLGKIFNESFSEQHADHYNPRLIITYNICADPEEDRTDSEMETP